MLLSLLLGSATAGVLPTDVRVEHLANGLTVYLAPMDTPGVVSWQVWVDSGNRAETTNSRGFSNYLQYLASSGSETMDRAERERQILLTGATDNSWSWRDSTTYHMLVPSEHLPSIIMIEANRLMYLDLSEQDLASTEGAVMGSWARSEADPGRSLDEAFARTGFSVHPYGHPTLGEKADIEAFDDRLDEIVAFYRTWYRPENTRIVVVGDFDEQAILTQINLTYGVWERGETVPAPAAEPKPQSTRRTHVDWDKGAAAPEIQMGWQVPGFDPRSKDAAALAVFQELLFSEVGVLHQDLVVERSLVYGLDGGSERFADPHYFRVEAALKHPDDLEIVEQAIVEDIQKMATQLDPVALASVRDSALARFRLSLDSPDAVADVIGEFTWGGRDADAIETFYANYSEVTPDDVRRVVDTWFHPDNLVVATLSAKEGE
jgi:zinc protease